MGGFYPYTKEANFNKIGENSAEVFNINIPWNIVEDPETKKNVFQIQMIIFLSVNIYYFLL